MEDQLIKAELGLDKKKKEKKKGKKKKSLDYFSSRRGNDIVLGL